MLPIAVAVLHSACEPRRKLQTQTNRFSQRRGNYPCQRAAVPWLYRREQALASCNRDAGRIIFVWTPAAVSVLFRLDLPLSPQMSGGFFPARYRAASQAGFGDLYPYDEQHRTLTLLSRVVGDVATDIVPILPAGVRAPGANVIRCKCLCGENHSDREGDACDERLHGRSPSINPASLFLPKPALSSVMPITKIEFSA